MKDKAQTQARGADKKTKDGDADQHGLLDMNQAALLPMGARGKDPGGQGGAAVAVHPRGDRSLPERTGAGCGADGRHQAAARHLGLTPDRTREAGHNGFSECRPGRRGG